MRPELKLATDKGVLFQGDCVAFLKRIEEKKVDCVFADPPFNLGKRYGSRRSHDRMPEQEYLMWITEWLDESVRILKPGGSLFVYHVPRWLIPIGEYLISSGEMQFRHWIAIKMKNHFPVEGRLHPAHYGLLYFTRKGGDHEFHVVRTPSPVCPHCGEMLRDYGGYGKKYRTDNNDHPLIQLADVWDDVGPRIREKTRPRSVNELNPVIPERAILMSTRKGAIVVDPFVGGGSTLVAAQRLGRSWVGTELRSTADARRRICNEEGVSRRILVPERLRGIFAGGARGLGRSRVRLKRS